MKLSTCVIIILLGVIAYGLWSPTSPLWQFTPVLKERQQATPPPTPQPSSTEVKKAVAKNIDDLDRYRFSVTVVQHLQDGHILVHGGTPPHNGRMAQSGDYAVLDLPGIETVPDGAQLRLFLGCFTGVYQYVSVDGSLRTVPEVVYTEQESFAELPKWDRYGHAINRNPSATPSPQPQEYRNPLNRTPYAP